ncbi:MAG TPA: MarC family protein [Tepidisphaeraceae bacterium]|jgi:multiple antibiotic resistance protein|nr:MarC family protein [Tepidisphaeraceae bacterium]
MRSFLETFVPLFVSIDAFGLVPLFLAFTAQLSRKQRRAISFEAVLAATIICLGFMFLGTAIFGLLGISTDDFMIAGGLILLVLAVMDLVMPGKPAVFESEMVGIVPLAMPLIAGPATLTNVLVLSAHHGHAMTALSLAVNFALLLAILLSADRIARLVGSNTLKAFSKLVMVLLAAIAVNLIRRGIEGVVD